MHSRIFALRYVSKDMPTEFEKLNENVDFDFFSSFADYVRNTDNEEEDIKWLTTCYKTIFSFEIKGNDIFIHIRKNGLFAFLEKHFNKFKEIAESYTFKDYTDWFSTNTYDLKELLMGDDCGFHFGILGAKDTFYTISYDNELETFRSIYNQMVRENLEEIVFRYEGSLDFHS